jgi:hypothetical protein
VLYGSSFFVSLLKESSGAMCIELLLFKIVYEGIENKKQNAEKLQKGQGDPFRTNYLQGNV